MQNADEVGAAAPLWVCQECRSVNALRLSRCYSCGAQRDAAGEIEVILDQPPVSPSTFQAPAGSPFAALGAHVDPGAAHGPGTPVMADPSSPRDAIAVGPGRYVEGEASSESPAEAEADAKEAVPDSVASEVERRT